MAIAPILMMVPPDTLRVSDEGDVLGMHFKTNSGRRCGIVFDDIVDTITDLNTRAVLKEWIRDRKAEAGRATEGIMW